MYGWSSGYRKHVSCPYTREKTVAVNLDILLLLRKIDKKLPGMEFIIYTDVEKNGDIVFVKPPIEVPMQTVTPGSVEVEEPPNLPAVIHKHPSSVRSFSLTDDKYINQNNRVSLLYVDGKIEKGVVTVRVPCGIDMIVEVEDIIYYIDRNNRIEIDLDKQLAKIKKKTPPEWKLKESVPGIRDWWRGGESKWHK